MACRYMIQFTRPGQNHTPQNPQNYMYLRPEGYIDDKSEILIINQVESSLYLSFVLTSVLVEGTSVSDDGVLENSLKGHHLLRNDCRGTCKGPVILQMACTYMTQFTKTMIAVTIKALASDVMSSSEVLETRELHS